MLQRPFSMFQFPRPLSRRLLNQGRGNNERRRIHYEGLQLSIKDGGILDGSSQKYGQD